ncbi:ParM/StbA family protein [Metabacillus litoralis]|uniref:ParM/StbA family protein n=1 Tax=Metabacillus litoralis TaxID=152268 RepID=UPI002042206B|nr:ParM/StbA family protein [Metabacillus litoralis]MCM3413216.1 ParM/StbA family protein [Metabacillus litoralis]
MRLASIDIGNDALKGYFGSLDQQLYIPNIIAKAEDRSIIDMEKNPLDALHVEVNSSILKEKTRKIAVGKLASKFPNNDELKPNQDKSESDQPILLLLTALAFDAVQNIKQDEDNIIHATYLLSTGLPLDETKREKNKEFRKKLKSGQHSVTFLKTPEFEGKTVRIQFEQVLVNTEGFAAYMDLTTDNDGSVKNEEIFGKTILINDIGGLSTDSAIITKDTQVDNINSVGIKKGVSTYLDSIIRKVRSEHQYTINTRRDLVEIITNEDPEEQNYIWKNGNRISIKNIVDDELTALANEEYKLIQDLWISVPDIRLGYQIGGGAVVLRPYLQKINEAGQQFPLRFVKPDDSVWMIARAYFKILIIYCETKKIDIKEAIAAK